MKIKVNADNGTIKSEITYEVQECGNESGYGGGQYVSIKTDGKLVDLVDARYMKGYSLWKASYNYLENYYGNNLVSITKIED